MVTSTGSGCPDDGTQSTAVTLIGESAGAPTSCGRGMRGQNEELARCRPSGLTDSRLTGASLTRALRLLRLRGHGVIRWRPCTGGLLHTCPARGEDARVLQGAGTRGVQLLSQETVPAGGGMEPGAQVGAEP